MHEKNFIDNRAADSFFAGMLSFPQYTRPRDFEGRTVPEVLLSGNHAEIKKWRQQKSLELTQKFRPDLLDGDFA